VEFVVVTFTWSRHDYGEPVGGGSDYSVPMRVEKGYIMRSSTTQIISIIVK
jgi:hypothetical protein